MSWITTHQILWKVWPNTHSVQIHKKNRSLRKKSLKKISKKDLSNRSLKNRSQRSKKYKIIKNQDLERERIMWTVFSSRSRYINKNNIIKIISKQYTISICIQLDSIENNFFSNFWRVSGSTKRTFRFVTIK